jgi:hypothetical protein
MRDSTRFCSPRTASAATGAIPTDARSRSQAGQALFICQPSYPELHKGFPDKNQREGQPLSESIKGRDFESCQRGTWGLCCSLIQLPLNRVLNQFTPAP